MNKISDKFHSLWDRLKKIKHIEIYIAIIFAVVIILIYLSTLGSPPKKENPVSTNDDIETSVSLEYTRYLENKLVNVLSKIKDAGEVNTIITLENGFEYIYVTEEETRVGADGGKITSTTVVLVDGKPVLEKEVYPHIKGIVVTATGADNISVRLNLLSAIQTIIDVPSENITILTGK